MAIVNREAQGVLAEWGGSQGVHLCHIFGDDEERARVMSEFVGDGLDRGEKVLCLEDGEDLGLVRHWLAQHGVTLEGRGEAFQTANAEQTYCPCGGLVPDSLLHSLAGFCAQAVQDGYSRVRIAGDMGWVVRRQVARELLLEYETKATIYARTSRAVAVCEYDARKFDGRTIMDVLSVHPAMLVRGQIVRNPYYVEAPLEMRNR